MSILQRMELSFWQIAIPLIRESKLLRFILTHFYGVSRKQIIISFIAPTALTAALGLAAGYIGGMLIH
ncbi:MAG: hypothetical protein ISR60_01695 [Anaerolineales bacterium]|nr:hypothetical protein [Anaerolineales bacterium]